MRSCIVLLVTMGFLVSCKKDAENTPPRRLSGVWVETTLRADTLDFSFMDLIDRSSDKPLVAFKSKPYTDISINPDYAVNHSSWYDYYFERDKIFLRTPLSSSSFFGTYSFLMEPDQQAFTVKRFYGRKSLPEIIRFEKLP